MVAWHIVWWRTLVVLVAVVGCKSEPSPPTTTAGSAARDAAVVVADAPPPDASDERAAVVLPETAPARKLYTDRIADAATFEAYSKEIGGERFAKFVIDLKSEAVWYFDVNVYPVHKDFVFTELYKRPKTREAIRTFDRNYGKTKTDFMMCYLVHHLQQDVWTLAFWDGDLATADHVRLAYQRMKETFFRGDVVKYRPDSNYQEHVAKQLGETVPYILNDQLYKLAEYAAFNKGTAVGTLRIAPPEAAASEALFAVDDIVILTKQPPDISPVAAIISEAFSTPLSHVSLRAKGWGIPNVGLKMASKKHADLADKVVYFEARDADYVLRLATAEEIAAAKAKREARKQVNIAPPDLVMSELRTLDQMTAADFQTVGPKAANLAIILKAKLPNVTVPPGFGVPFHYYDAHVKAAGIDRQILAVLGDVDVAKNPTLRKVKLEAVRKAIVAAPLAPELCAKVGTALAALPPDRGVFVRSSHNAEDLEDFSGAGLHDTVPNVKGTEKVCDAIKAVWASAWKLNAYDARAHAGIDQARVAAGAFIQTAVAATAAGVMATVHPTDPTDERSYTINAKSGLGMAVVDGRKVPESLLVSWYNHGIRVLSRSDEDTKLVFDAEGGVHEVPNPAKGKPVLTNQMAIKLADTGHALTKLFKNKKLDVEWVFAGDELNIVQTRPLVGE